jgi:hypothetical protein
MRWFPKVSLTRNEQVMMAALDAAWGGDLDQVVRYDRDDGHGGVGSPPGDACGRRAAR